MSLVSIVVALAACDSSAHPAPAAPPPAPPSVPAAPPDVPAAPPPLPPAPAPAAYEVHEWGLLSLDSPPGAPPGPAVLAAVPARPAAPTPNVPFPRIPRINTREITVDKPVLYVHLDEGTDELTFQARVAMPAGGVLVEHWPERTLDAEGTVTWSGVRAHRGECRPRRYPTLTEFPCNGLEGCEAATLAQYETSDGACLTASNRDYDHLFYRGQLPTFEAPLALERAADGAVVARNPTGEMIGPFVVRVTVRAGRLSVLVSDAVGEGGEVTIPSPTAHPAPQSAMTGAAARAAGIEALVAGLRGVGLTEPEIDAFARAWWNEIFSTRRAPPRDELVYWLPQGLADRAAVLRFEPQPRSVRRALLVRQAL